MWIWPESSQKKYRRLRNVFKGLSFLAVREKLRKTVGILSRSTQSSKIKRANSNKGGQRCRKPGVLMHCCGSANWCNHCGNEHGAPSGGHASPGTDPVGSIPVTEMCAHPYSPLLCLTTRTWKGLMCSITDEWIMSTHLYTMKFYSAVKIKEICRQV